MNAGMPQTRPALARRNQQRRRGTRWLPYAGGLVIVALIVAGLLPRPAPVETARATIGTVRSTVNEEGKTRINQRFLVSAPVTGHLTRIPFKPGAEIIAGVTVVAVIEPVAPAILDARTRSLAEARRDTAAAHLERARAAHHFASIELRRMQTLASEKTISAQDLENAQWRETSAAKEFAAAQSALREAEAELAEYAGASAVEGQPPIEIEAPASGRVLRVFEESARVVMAGTPLMEIGDPTDLEVVVEVLSRDGAAIRPGAKVELDQWGGSGPLEARVRLVEPAAFTKVSALGVEEQRVNLIADIVTPVAQRRALGDNFRVEARIVMAEAINTLKAPSGSIFRHGQAHAVLMLRNGRARLQQVTVGLSSGSEIQVLDGLREGDEVIVYPGDRVQDGQRVSPIKVSVDD